jgi:hypothetical protein
MSTFTVQLRAMTPEDIEDALCCACRHYSSVTRSLQGKAATLAYIMETGDINDVMDCIDISQLESFGVEVAIA